MTDWISLFKKLKKLYSLPLSIQARSDRIRKFKVATSWLKSEAYNSLNVFYTRDVTLKFLMYVSNYWCGSYVL